MKKTLVAASLLSTLFAASAGAQAPDRVEVQASNLTRVHAAETYKEFKGTYDMDDGSRLTFNKAGSRYFATLDAAAPVEIKLSAPNQFSSVSGRTQLKFAMDAKSPIAYVTLRKDDGTVIASGGATAAAAF
ncbi:MAG: hypothetical protein JNJ55_01405 [Betaproteobacteria bacterium]|nr:hypothetical protein [Betaproteobacteria bacterium]